MLSGPIRPDFSLECPIRSEILAPLVSSQIWVSVSDLVLLRTKSESRYRIWFCLESNLSLGLGFGFGFGFGTGFGTGIQILVPKTSDLQCM